MVPMNAAPNLSDKIHPFSKQVQERKREKNKTHVGVRLRRRSGMTGVADMAGSSDSDGGSKMVKGRREK
jgi:hypothetical protein